MRKTMLCKSKTFYFFLFKKIFFFISRQKKEEKKKMYRPVWKPKYNDKIPKSFYEQRSFASDEGDRDLEEYKQIRDGLVKDHEERWGCRLDPEDLGDSMILMHIGEKSTELQKEAKKKQVTVEKKRAARQRQREKKKEKKKVEQGFEITFDI